MSTSPPSSLRAGGGLVVVAFDPAWLRVFIPPSPITAADALATEPRIVGLLDGAMFRPCEGSPTDYESYVCGDVDYAYLDAVGRIARRSRYPARGASLLVDARGRAACVDGGDPYTWPVVPLVAWQGYPALIRDGVRVVSGASDTQRVGRAGAGRLADGRLFFAAMRASMLDFTIAVESLGGVTDLVYSDGGGSTVLALRDGETVSAPGDLTRRRLPSFLVLVDPALARWGMRSLS